MTFKLGRQAPKFTMRHMKMRSYMRAALDTLGTPPAQSADFITAVDKAVGSNIGMFLNDSLGDCTCADTAHALMFRTANAGKIVLPVNAEVLKLYEAVGHYVPGHPNTDQGAMESDVCEYLTKTGFIGHKSQGSALIAAGNMNATSLDHLRWTTQIFVGCRLGVNLPQSAEDQFGAGKPWDVSGDATIIGGHDVGMVGYDATYAYLTTWGTVWKATWAWIEAYVEEAYAEAWPDALQVSSGLTPSHFNLAGMVSYMGQMSVA